MICFDHCGKLLFINLMEATEQQFDKALASCRGIFEKKLKDYGASWRIMRPCSITDQIFIKAKRIRSIGTKGCAMVNEGILPEFMAIVNYGLVGLIMLAKHHDYDEAWRMMRLCSYTDMILSKIQRTKQIEDHEGHTLISEGIDANYMDMINYAVFAIIKLTE